MKLAIQYEKINLNYDDCIYKPNCMIQGEEIEEDGITLFLSDCGIEYEPVSNIQIDMGHYYMHATDIEELKKAYGDEYTDEELKAIFMDDICQYYYAMRYSYELGDTELVMFSMEDINNNSDLESFYINEENNVEIVMSLQNFKDLKNMQSLEELNKYVDDITDSVQIAVDYIDENDAEEVTVEKEKNKSAKVKTVKGTIDNINLKQLRHYVLQNIIDQEKAVNDITRTILINSTSKNPRNKSHILIAGPTGTGKTEIVNLISEKIGVPVFKADATAYTKEGYVGKSVYSMLEGLINAAGGDVEKAQKGILIIDEIDKKASNEKGDVSGQDVLFSLLKMLDRGEVEVTTGGYYGKTVMFDTSDLTIICMGAFSDLYEQKKTKKKNLGFGSVEEESEEKEIELTEADFVKYGMPPEFMGRVCITYTKALDEESLIKILDKSKISPLNIEKEYFNDLGIKVVFTKSYKQAIAKEAIKAGTGARKLKGSVKRTLENVYDEVLTSDKPKTYKLTKETVKDSKKYYVK